jgi:energy-coupling factor transporter ATP-binding protein EcfA2
MRIEIYQIAMNKLRNKKRWIVVGHTGSGKSTLARQIAQSLTLKSIELDSHFWLANWAARDSEDFMARATKLTRGRRWVVDGNYKKIRPVVWPRAEVVVWLDLPFRICLSRMLARTVRRWWGNELLWESKNRETLWGTLLKRDGLLWWLVSTFRGFRRDLLDLKASGKYPKILWKHLKGPREVREFLNDLTF